MYRVRLLTNPQTHLSKVEQQWLSEIDCIKSVWWYNQLSNGNKRFLSYRLSLIEVILQNAHKPDARVYKFGTQGIASVLEYDWGWWFDGVAIAPNLLKDISGKSSGIGRRLIKHVEYDAKRNRVECIKLHPGHSNLHKFYESLGYSYDGVIRNVGKVWVKTL